MDVEARNGHDCEAMELAQLHFDEWHGIADDGREYCDHNNYCFMLPTDRRGLDASGEEES